MWLLHTVALRAYGFPFLLLQPTILRKNKNKTKQTQVFPEIFSKTAEKLFLSEQFFYKRNIATVTVIEIIFRITIEDTNKLQKLYNDDKALQMLKDRFQKQFDTHYHKISPSDIVNTDVDESRNKNKDTENYNEVDTFIGLPHIEKRYLVHC